MQNLDKLESNLFNEQTAFTVGHTLFKTLHVHCQGGCKLSRCPRVKFVSNCKRTLGPNNLIPFGGVPLLALHRLPVFPFHYEKQETGESDTKQSLNF